MWLPAQIITKYSLERFLSICSQKISKRFLKFCKLISNRMLGQIIVSNLFVLQTCINYPHKLQKPEKKKKQKKKTTKKSKQKSNTTISRAYQSR